MKIKIERSSAALIIATVFWGIQPLCVKVLVLQWSPAALTSVRYLLISSILFIMIYFRGENMLLPRKYILPIIVMGLTGIAVNSIAQFTGLQHSTITNCTLITSLGPAITALLAAFILKERLNLLQWLGIFLSMTGALILFTKGNINILLDFSFNKGDILFFLCQIVWAVYSFIGVYVMKKVSVIVVTAWAGLFGAVITAVYALATGTLNYIMLPIEALYALFFIVLFGGVCSMLCWNIGVKYAGPSLAAVFANITPLIGILSGVVFFSEEFGIVQLSGATAIILGVYMTTNYKNIATYIEVFTKRVILLKSNQNNQNIIKK